MRKHRLLLTALIAGCIVLRSGWAAEADNACDLSKDPGEGLAIVSGTLPTGQNRANRVGFPQSFAYTYNTADATSLTNRVIALVAHHWFSPVKSDFSDVFGKVFILRLRPGTYQFRDWSYKPFGLTGIREPHGIHPLTFEVQAGRAVYLGSFEPALFTARNWLHQKSTAAWLMVRDRHSRDLSAFLQQCPGYDLNRLDIEVMDSRPWIPSQHR
jgi:hypothetical protein